MSDRPDYETDKSKAADTSFMRRWSQRKLEQRRLDQQATEAKPAPESAPPARPPVSEPPLPSIDEINEDSEVSAFFGEGVSETLRRQALRKLFGSSKFNVVDGLDDYAEDYNAFEPLGKIVTAHQRLREERDKLRQALAENEESQADGVEPAAAPGEVAEAEPRQQPNDVAAVDTDVAHAEGEGEVAPGETNKQG